jgi:hypothetical protein
VSYLWIFAIFDAGALLLVASELLAPSPSLAPTAKPRVAGTAAVALLVASYAVQLAALAYAVRHQSLPLGPTGLLPLPLLGGIAENGDAVAIVMLLCGALQTYALWNAFRSPPPARAVVAGAVALAALSLGSPAMLSPDAYAYVGNAIMGLASYAPPATALTGDFAAIDRWWGTPVPATPYGPLWLATAWIVTAAFPALLAKVLAFRVLGLLSLAALLAVLRAARLPARAILLAALNPALYFQFVASAHNDLFGIVLLLAGGLYVQTRPIAAIALIAAGALVKLPFALFAAPLLALQRSPATRIAMLAVIVVAAAAISLLAGGDGFVHAQRPHLVWGGIAGYTTLAVAAAAVAALGVAFARGRRLRSAVWLMPLVSAYTCAWYLLWALPYAVARRRIVAYLLTAYPLVSILLEVKFMRPWTLFAVVPAAVAIQALAWRRR